MTSRRIDSLLVERGMAADLREAKAFVMAGKVIAGDRLVEKAGETITDTLPLRLKLASKYVSRGGEKLEGALKQLGLESSMLGRKVVDIGSSTGGFTDCCLALGASHVIALDCGKNQLAWKLRVDDRVTVKEGSNFASTSIDTIPAVDWILVDLSFTSLSRFAKKIAELARRDHASILALVKPQFELPKHLVPEGGVVLQPEHRALACRRVQESFAAYGINRGHLIDCVLPGRKGNREIFFFWQSGAG